MQEFCTNSSRFCYGTYVFDVVIKECQIQAKPHQVGSSSLQEWNLKVRDSSERSNQQIIDGYIGYSRTIINHVDDYKYLYGLKSGYIYIYTYTHTHICMHFIQQKKVYFMLLQHSILCCTSSLSGVGQSSHFNFFWYADIQKSDKSKLELS